MLSLVFRTLAYFRGLLIPVALGVAVASAVIVGALVVGDSMRGSLRFIAMDRIGTIDSVLIAPRWFNESLVQNLTEPGVGAANSLVFVQSAMAEREEYRASEMALLGVDQDFWSMGTIAPKRQPTGEEVILNRALADKLQASVGDQVTLRVESQAVVPADSPLGKRDQDRLALPRWRVIEILPDVSLARFSLRSDQRPIMNAFADKKSLQGELEIHNQVNAIFVAQTKTPQDATKTKESKSGKLLERLSPKLTDLGLKWQHVQRSFPDEKRGESRLENAGSPANVLDYHQLTTDQMLIGKEFSDQIVNATGANNPRSVLTYLANGVQLTKEGQSVGRNVPYSTISAVDWPVLSDMLSKGRDTSEPVVAPKPSRSDWVVVTQWLANELSLHVGDTLQLDYYLPETVDGDEVEKSFAATVVAIAPLTAPKSGYTRNREATFAIAPTPFNDPAWTPVVPGITDQESISKWDTPFPLTRKVEKPDDEYWNDHRLTPKLFISTERGIELFGSRFGNVSSIRFDGLKGEQAIAVETTIASVATKHLSQLGWREIPLRQQQLRASSGTTPFDALFLSLSFFVIVAALLLVAILFRLAIEQRADHWGLLLASGWTRGSVRRLLLTEGAIVCAFGATLGVFLGLGYAYLMIAGLRSWWIGAITISFLEYHANPLSLVIGWLLSWLAAIGTILLSTRMLRRIPIARLLKKRFEGSDIQVKTGSGRSILAIGCGVLAISILLVGQWLQGQAQAGAFVGAGMLFLVAGVLWVLGRLKRTDSFASEDVSKASSVLSDSALASSSAKRAPMRSILAIGLVAIASFLILSMSLFQASPDEAGTGRFAFIGRSSQAIHDNIAKPEKQKEVLGKDASALSGLDFVPMRVRGGDDASCSNLYQASEPQVLGVSSRMETIDRNAKGVSSFAWFGTANSPGESPWTRLQRKSDGSEESPIPVVLDQNTALWALHLGGYVGEKFSYSYDDRKVHFVTVGVLQNTILQGSLLIGEANFERLFPSITGYRMFLIKESAENQATEDSSAGSVNRLENARMVMEKGWSDSGLSLASSDSVLRQLLAVQNTYLGAFQVLGALGLLLGTIGLGVSQLRSAMERRGELAAMRAIGFTKSRLVWLLTLENGWQLLRGVGIGTAAAALATLPAILNGQPFHGLVWPSMMMGIVVACGLACSVIAAWGAMQWPLLKALRDSG